ncbi:MAG: nitrogen regulation protein NR(II) [Gammaproteobacteria bacterium]|nr:nitrogen regulation protein NR(II) [Gammaproteobacteria bacterium]
MKNAITNNDHLLQRIIDNLDTVIMCFDQDFRLVYINPAGEMLFSSSEKNMVGQKACDLMQCPDVIVGLNLKKALDMNQPLTEREVILPLPDHSKVVVDCSVIPFYGDTNDDKGLIVEIQILDRHIRISREEQLMTQQNVTRSLVRGLAHEVKNPLGGIRGAAQLLEAELHSEELREYTQIIIGEADRLQVLVDSMLGPNKLTRKQLLNIHDVIERVRSLVLAENTHISIWRDYDPSIPDLFADNDQLIQAILNIVKNAVKALADVKQPKITIKTRIVRQMTINSKRHRHVAKIQIVDNGPGIPEEMKEKIFFPLVSGTEGGVGVGLSISQTLINKHGGLIECQSQPGNTVFTIWIPLENESD